jgi:hypothetical protein
MVLYATFSFSLAAAADKSSKLGEPDVTLKFDTDSLDQDWLISNGQWVSADGVLKVKELAADKHAASARYTLETEDAIYQLRFRFRKDGTAFHLGFDPAPGALKKRGHLFSVVITPSSAKVLKHVDKANPQADPNETLAEETVSISPETWYTLRVTTVGSEVKADIDGTISLHASHASFAVKKPTLVFRCLGDGVEVDDIKVWKR